ncbi:MAG: SPFH/Band 7/PHB domain protein [SAR86 cluster bacterium]|nr:SPFH/Band 7/PHB domain protein [SAR86 cluster bacterium]
MEISGSLIFSILFTLVGIFVLWSGIKFVPQGFNYTKTRFGRFNGIMSPGLNFLIPFIEAIDQRVNVMEQVLDIAEQSVITKDNAEVKVDAVLFYQVLEAEKAAYAVSNLANAQQNLGQTNIRTVVGSMSLDDVLSNRDSINQKLLGVIDEATEPWGVKVTRVEIKGISPPQNIVDAMSLQMTAEREKRAVVLEAEGKKEAAFREAEARERLAEAEANATASVSTAIAEGELSALNYFVAKDYVGALKEIASADNQKVILMPLEAASVIGSIAGIAELTKEAFSKESEES